MKTYIDSKKLIAEIEKILSRADKEEKQAFLRKDGNRHIAAVTKTAVCSKIKKLVTSLQQEPKFPQYDNIIDKVFGAGNLEGFEYHEAEMLVALAKEELLKSLQQEQPKFKVGDTIYIYPLDKFDGEIGDSIRAACSVGYIQAEKDLALTWEDMAKIDAIILDVNNEFAVDYSKEISRQKFYEEVLRRFNEIRKK